MKTYVLNTKQHTLHIVGLCPHSKSKEPYMKFFSTESAAMKYDPRGIKFCKICDKKKDDMVSDAVDCK